MIEERCKFLSKLYLFNGIKILFRVNTRCVVNEQLKFAKFFTYKVLIHAFDNTFEESIPPVERKIGMEKCRWKFIGLQFKLDKLCRVEMVRLNKNEFQGCIIGLFINSLTL